MKYKSILLLGAPGSGKGTQGKVIGCVPGFIHVSTGDLFRALDRNSELGKVFTAYSTRGELVPDDFTVKLWSESMKQWGVSGKLKPATDVLVLDGIPRNLAQSQLLADSIDVLKIIYLDVSDMNKMVERLRGRALKEKRKDDADENVIRNRMEVYNRETRPVIDFYPADRVAKVDALMSPIRVFSEIVKILVPLKEQIDKA